MDNPISEGMWRLQYEPICDHKKCSICDMKMELLVEGILHEEKRNKNEKMRKRWEEQNRLRARNIGWKRQYKNSNISYNP